MFWLPGAAALIAGDRLLGEYDGRQTGGLRLCPESWLDGATHKALRKSLQPLLGLRIERILVSHGDPVLSGAKDALAALIGA